MSPTASAQLYTSTTSTGNWLNTTGTAGRWSSSSSGPFSSNFVASSNTIFATAGTYTFDRLVTTGTATLGNITTVDNVSIGFTTTSGQTLSFGGAVSTLDFGAGSVVDFGSLAITLTNGIIKNGAGTLVLTGGGYTGGFTLNAGSVIARGANAFGTGAITINGGAIGSMSNFTSPIRANGPISVGGDFQIGIADSPASNTANMTFGANGNGLNLTGGARTITLGSSGTMTFAQAISNGGLTLARNIAGAGGQFSLSGPNTFADGLTLDSVTVNATNNNAALGAGDVTLTGADATTLNIQGARTIGNAFTIADSSGTKTITGNNNSGNITGTITNSDSTGGLVIGSIGATNFTVGVIDGAGTTGVTFGGSTLLGTVTMTGSSSYAGDTRIDSSTLKMSGAGAVPNGKLVFQGTGAATFDLNGTTQTVAGLDDSAFAGIIRSTSSGAKLIVGDSNNSTFAGKIISGNSLELEKVGSGKLTLTGTNTYSGATTVAAGLLTVDGSSYGSAHTVQSGATLGGSGTVGALVVETGATIAPGNSPGTLTVSGDAVWEAGGNYNWQLVDADGGAGADWDTIHITGELDLSNLTLADPFKVNLWSLSSPGASTGDALNFDGSLNYSWTIATAAGGITGFDADNFSIYTAAMNGTNGFSNDFTGGTFSVGVTGNDLNLMYHGPSAVPEPASAFTVLALFSSGVLHRRRRVVRG
jgi:autotransporter-associated beta strand protein